jgi:RIO kinase 2
MKLDVNALRYLEREDFRVLTAVEMGQKNHELVPLELVLQIADLRLGGLGKIVTTLMRNKLLHHDHTHFDGYRLTNLGYDYLALRAFCARGSVAGIGRQIGVGKESDIFVVQGAEERVLCMKCHRLGRTSFRAIKNKRDYHSQRGSPSWLYLSRLAATKEMTFMKVLRDHGFPVPEPVDSNRHCIIMSLVEGFPLVQVSKMEDPDRVYNEMMDLVERFARFGLIHGDFNEFNIMISKEGVLTVIDFPQMVSVRHPNARMYFDRDVNCVRRFFRKRFQYVSDRKPSLQDCLAHKEKELDVQVAASGWSFKQSKELDRFITLKKQEDHDAQKQERGEGEENDEEESENEDEDDEEGEDEGQGEDLGEGEEGDATEAEGAANDSKELGGEGSEQDESQNDGPLVFEKLALSQAPGLEEAVEPPAAPPAASGAQATDDAEEQAEGEGGDVFEEGIAASAIDDDEDDSSDRDSLGDGPGAHLAHEVNSNTGSRMTRGQPSLDDIRRRVKRDFTRKAKQARRGVKATRNTTKSRQKKQLNNEINSEKHDRY